MRRGAAAASFALVLAASVASAAGAKGGSTQLNVRAPKVGQATVQVVTMHITAPKGQKVPKLKLKITNLSALGKGFDAVATVSGPKAQGSKVTLKIFIVSFMGNLSSAPASTMNIQTNVPAGEAKTSTKDVTKDCATINSIYALDTAGYYLLVAHIGDGESPPGSFMKNTTSYICHK